MLPNVDMAGCKPHPRTGIIAQRPARQDSGIEFDRLELVREAANKFQSMSVGPRGLKRPLSNPTPAVRPWPPERDFLPEGVMGWTPPDGLGVPEWWC